MTTSYFIKFTPDGEAWEFKTLTEAVTYGLTHLEVWGEGDKRSFIIERYQTEVFMVTREGTLSSESGTIA